MKLISWNVNGIRSAARGGLLEWFKEQKADVVCVQEIKAFEEQLEDDLKNPDKYHAFWNPAKKPGYSGTAIFAKKEPLSVKHGLGIAQFDNEGRVMTAEFPEVTVVNAYFPNSQRDHARLPFKLLFCDAIFAHLQGLRAQGKNLVLCGDFNIAHKEIDLKNPKSNMKNAGFLPEERAWFDHLMGSGYLDTFRQFESGPGHYSWWSYRPGVREKNVGWRLDYHVCNPELGDRLKKAQIQCEVKGSDHCPVLLELKS